MNSPVYDHFRLHISVDNFYLVPYANEASTLVIDRVSNEINVERGVFNIPPTTNKSKEIFGVFGIITLLNGPNLIVITKRERIGLVHGSEIWRAAEFDILPYKTSKASLNESQKADLDVYISMLQTALDTPSFYYSSTYDLTHSVQRISLADPNFHGLDLCLRADQRFVWNSHALSSMMEQTELLPFCLPIMHGMIKIVSCFVRGRTFDLMLISRRSNKRAGTRYNVRGVNENGDVANFVETEQIVFYHHNICSIVQTRGSIPLIWNQFANIKYKPPIGLSNEWSLMQNYFNRHIQDQIMHYDKQYLLNLVNQHGSENLLAMAFGKAVEDFRGTVPNKREYLLYEAFDFHHHCGRNKWHNLNILMRQIELSQTEFGFFMMVPKMAHHKITKGFECSTANSHVVMKQSGVFRTNCMDCLDRTNVVQSMIAKRSLQTQLRQLGILDASQTVEQQLSLNKTMRNIWADNADACSVQYAGTGALKTDFTRTGKRTIMGMLQDGVNSMVRYWKNNFMDGKRQDSIDLLLGNFVVTEQVTSPFRDQLDNFKKRGISVGIFYGVTFAIVMFKMMNATGILTQFTSILFLAAVTWTIFYWVVQNGTKYVNCPLLFHSKQKSE